MEQQNQYPGNKTPHARGLSDQFDVYAVDDPQAPAYYSQRSTMAFSVVFTVLYGAALLIFNLEQKKHKWLVALYGVSYTVFMIVVLNNFNRNTGLTLAANGLGGIFLVTFFWNKYIGQKTYYRKKSIKKPLLISILVTVPIIALIINSAIHPE